MKGLGGMAIEMDLENWSPRIAHRLANMKRIGLSKIRVLCLMGLKQGNMVSFRNKIFLYCQI